MIITRTPFRASFLGGGSDYNSWSSKNGGIVVGAAIDKYCHITARFLPPFHEYRSRFVYSMTECCHHNSSVSHKAIRATLRYLGLTEPDSPGLEVMHASDLPARSGTGSSSSFVVGLLKALSSLQGKLMLPYELADTAIDIEQNLLGETVGCQDQTFAAYGGLNTLRFGKNGGISVEPLTLDARHIREMEEHLLLFFTKMPRTASDIAKNYAPSLGQKPKEMFALMRLAEQGIDAIYRKNWERLGQFIDQSWRIKSGLAEGVTNDAINRLYAAARLAGAFGGKLTGAGAGGCLLLVAPPEKRQAILSAIPNAVHIPFHFDFPGSTVIFSDKDNIREYRQSA